jgi:hypothetical protein
MGESLDHIHHKKQRGKGEDGEKEYHLAFHDADEHHGADDGKDEILSAPIAKKSPVKI